MKRILSLLLTLLLLCTLVACAPSPAPSEPSESEESQTAPPTSDPVPCDHVYNAIVTPPTEEAQGYTTHTCTLCGASYVDSYVEKLVTFKIQYDDYIPSFGSVQATSDTAQLSGDALEIVTVNDTKYFHAKDLGEVTLTDGDRVQKIIVEKAKINLVLVMGQSNSVAGGESVSYLKNALSDISSPLGTAYHWGNSSKQPEHYTQPTRGFHSTLLAELYEQSVAAGNPVKNVLIWEDGMTSYSGKSITNWASESEAKQVTEDVQMMVKRCAKYYTTDNAQYYEVISRGMYWLQGEIDGSTLTPEHTAMTPEKYENCFMKMWNKLKSGTGLSYVAFLRVRGDIAENQQPTAENPDHNDIAYNTALAAQLNMIAKRDNFYLATSITEHWVGTEDTAHTIDIRNYITLMKQYSGGTRFDDGYNVATYADGALTTTMKELFGSAQSNYAHYGKFGYTLLGADAAYNMYRALHGDSFAIVQGDTSGKPAAQTEAKAGDQKVISLANTEYDIAFRAAPGSTAGKLTLTVMNGDEDITSLVTVSEGANLGAIDAVAIKDYDQVTITVTYTPKNGTAGSVVYTVAK